MWQLPAHPLFQLFRGCLLTVCYGSPTKDTVVNQMRMALPAWNFLSHFHKESIAMPSSEGLISPPFLMGPQMESPEISPQAIVHTRPTPPLRAELAI